MKMSLEAFNINLFDHLNAPIDASSLMVYFAKFIANDTLYIMLIFLVLSWFLGNRHNKELALKAVITTAIALAIGFTISTVYPHPRPFMIDEGRTLIWHAADSSFPSDHMLIFSSIAFAYLFAKEKQIGLFFFFLAVEVGWSRVYLGVHFPFDILGGLFVAMFTGFFVQKLWDKYGVLFINFALSIYHKLFANFIEKGWIR